MSNAKQPEMILTWDLGMEAIYLSACALHGTVPTGVDSANLKTLYRFCAQHSIVAMVAMALESGWKMEQPENPGVTEPWKQAKDKAIRKNILLNAERERILGYLDSIGCWYMPLKGSLLQHDYPKFGMRQMSDNDILFDSAFDKQIYDFMCGSSYTAEDFGKHYHDEYVKKPVYNFELHRSLFGPLAGKRLTEYYRDIHRLMVKDTNNRCGYHFSPEDFYVYLTAHSYKHYVCSGNGIRSLVDVYVYLNKHKDTMNWDYVEQELEKLGVLDYERQSRDLAEKLFAEPRRNIRLSEDENALLDSFVGSGTYGNRKIMVKNKLTQMEQKYGGSSLKLRYFWERLFPPREFMEEWDPNLLERPWMLPLAYFKRLGIVIFTKPMRAIREIGYLITSPGANKD